MKTEKIKLSKIKRNPDNPRLIKDNKFYKLVKSIKDFPEMLEIRPIVVNEDMIVLGGNMRLKACQEAGLKEVPVIQANELSAEQQREFIVKDNVGFGEWDWDMIANEWEVDELKEWGMDVPKFELSEDDKDLSDTLIESLRIEVEMESEEEQEKLYNELIQKGYKCRVLTL